MAGHLSWFVAGLVGLIIGAEMLVRGGSRVAGSLGISPIIVGLTVVSIGTSMPELAVGVLAAAEGSGTLAVGNIAGTNTFNLLFILGLSAAIKPLSIPGRTLRFDLPAMTAAAILLWVLAADGVLSRIDGVVLVSAAVMYSAALIYTGRRESRQLRDEFVAEFSEDVPAPARLRSRRAKLAWNTGLLLVGIAIVVIGADWLVDGAVGIAGEFGVSDAFIGLTVVAIGTSAPELVTTVVATLRGQRDIALGNLLGSSIYNIVLILGVTVLVPAGGLHLGPDLVRIDIPVMVVVVLLCIPVFVTGRRVTRAEGASMVAAYLAYLTFLLMTQL
ncbi:MAG: calcium/sodium antiporter [Mycobacterium sp.]